ncbi:Alpha/Beta hydrolase protein [Immersiella caudata]|uniref:Alpha/Beta hydrolase protein n=1 Tax=Immersiella caudata TaxID=314043 RepID=A0AA40BUC1_9PEZI|nr:Alpha/Beta hydrolase protein [Immersiella caudata]
MHQFFPSIFFNFETIRILGMAPTGGAELAECLEAVGQIRDNDPESWHLAWSAQARKAEAIASSALASNDRESAKRALLRAHNYTRASYYMLPGGGPLRPDPRYLPLLEKSVSLFRSATELFHPGTVHRLEIPFGDIKLSGYLYLPPPWRRLPNQQKAPILIANSGADGLSEEIYFMAPAAALERGYAAVTYEGPGQGLTLHRDGVPFRPDWEVVASAVLDHLETLSVSQPELQIDTDRVAIWGTSLGGYFALRAAAGDPRFKACVAVDPVHDFWDFATTQVPQAFLTAWGRGWIGDGTVDAIIHLGTKLAFQMKWNIATTGTFFGLRRPSEILKVMRNYTLRLPGGGSLLERIRCPVLVTGAKASLYLDVDAHTGAVYQGLKSLKEGSEKQLWVGETPGDGGLQAKVGALALSSQRALAFLDTALGVEREEL